MPSSQVMHEWGQNRLHSGSKKGPIVKSQKQAVAIMLSEKRKEGAHGGKYPERQMGGMVPPPMGMGMPPQGQQGLGTLPMLGKLPPSMGMGRPYQFGGSPTSQGLTTGWMERQEARSMHTGPILSTVGGRTDQHNINVPSGSYVFPAAHVSALGQGNTINGLKVLSNMFGPSIHNPRGMGIPRATPPRPMNFGAAPGLPASMRADGGGATFKQRFPASAWTPLGAKDAGPSIDEAFSNVNDEFPLGNALRAKAKTLQTPDKTSTFSLFGSSAGGSRGHHVGKPVPIAAAGGEYVLGPDQVMRVGGGDLERGHKILDAWVQRTHKKYAKTIANLPPPAKS